LFYDFVYGFFLGLVLDVVWSKGLNLKVDKAPIMEHYHWGLILILIDKYLPWNLLSGIAAALIVSEWTGDKLHPFAWGKTHFKESTIIGLIISIMVPIAWWMI
jgi:hypothetical protein